MLDPALIGSTVMGVLALFAQAVSKCKCYVACKKDEEGEFCEPQCACGFLDTTLVDLIMPERNETPCSGPDAAATEHAR